MDDDQQFCLRWNNHQSTLISVFDTLLENGTLVDCTLAAEGKFLKAHKVVLSACSPYFAALLSQQYDKHPIFILKDVKFQELRAMMDYMYRGEVNISQDQLAALLKAAESLQIKGLSDNRNNSMPNKSDNIVKPPPPVPASAKGGLTISENKRKQLLGADIETDVSVSREGSTSPTRKRKKIGRRRSIDANNLLDNHEQHSNSSSHSTPHVATGATNNIATSTPIVLPVTKKTDHETGNKTGDSAVDNATAENSGSDDVIAPRKDTTGKRPQTADDQTHSELIIEPKNEYDEEDDDDGNEACEDLTLDDEDMMEDLDQAGPSHGGEGSSSGYGNWQMERSQDEGFMVGQEGGQHRDAQGGGAEDLSITKIAGLTWNEWNARLAMPLVQTLCEGSHPLVFPRELSSSSGSMDIKPFGNGGLGSSGNGNANSSESAPQFACPDCGRMYKLKSSLRNHQKWECGKEPQFQCPYCVYRAKQKMHIGRHMERMHKERFFKVESDKVVALDMGSVASDMNAMSTMNNTC